MTRLLNPIVGDLVWDLAAGLDPDDAAEIAIALGISEAEIDDWSATFRLSVVRRLVFACLPPWVLCWLFDHTCLKAIVRECIREALPRSSRRTENHSEPTPLAVSIMMAILRMPRDVYRVCARTLGTLRVEPWRSKSSATVSSLPRLWRLTSSMRWRVAFLVASLLLSTYAHVYAHPASGVALATFTNLYVQSGGNDMNAGSSTANAADATSTNGSWDITAETFIVAGSGVFSTVPNVGDWASIYPDGTSTGAVYVAQVTAVGALGVSVTLSTTAKYGTKPSANATGRSCKINGAWASELAPVALTTSTVPASTKVNWKQATYTITANRTIAWAGATTTPLWFSGYNTTPGDLDADITNTLTKPVLAMNSTFLLTYSGAHQLVTGFSVTGVRSGALLSVSGSQVHCSRIRVNNTSSNAAAIALSCGGTNDIFAYSWFKTPTTATTTGTVQVATSGLFVGCVSEGGGKAAFNMTSGVNGDFFWCIALNATGQGWLYTAPTRINLISSTAYNPTVDGVQMSLGPTQFATIAGCLFSNCGGYGINNAGTATNFVWRSCNDFYSCTLGNENGFADSPAFFGQTESGSPMTSSTDMTPIVGANARNNGFPKVFEGGGALGSQANPGMDIGAVRHADATPPVGHVTGARSIGTY